MLTENVFVETVFNNRGDPMRRHIATAAAPRRWRRRRTARIALAVALVVLAPFAGHSDTGNTGNTDTGTSDPTASGGTAAASSAGADGTDDTRGDVRVVPVPLADPAVAELLRPGDLVDLVSAAEISPDPAIDMLVARAARVRDIPAGRPGSRSILVEVPQAEAARIAAIAAGTPLAVIVHG